MTDNEQRAAAKKFASDWKDKGYEKGQSHSFWLSLLRDVYGVVHPEQFILFEEQVHLDHTSFIDATIPETRVLIEQKSLGKDLKKPVKQSNGTLLTPFQQAKRYITELPVSKHPRWVVTCNFAAFLVYDMEKPGGEPEEILLENLPEEFYRLSFLTDTGSEHIKREMAVSIAAGKIVGLLYDAFAKRYVDPSSEHALKSLNMLCVRLVFCLYAENAGIFGKYGMFHDYLSEFDAKHMRRALINLFLVLDTPPEKRDPYLEPELAAFPYVNGGLFEPPRKACSSLRSGLCGDPGDIEIEIPQFTDEIKTLLLEKASEDFNWSDISPTIFGGVFESTLNPETRRSGGMHYTSIENIHKVIDPLFLDALKKEFEDICGISVEKTKTARLREFQDKLSKLTFFDPACGSGNFLTETYISLRRLENDVLRILQDGKITLGDEAHSPIKVSIGQFFGIEINDFAVTVARTALWIAESQMMRQTEDIVHMNLDYLPLKSYPNITEGNALRMDWGEVIPKDKCSYIMGNPPFVGYAYQSKEQKADIALLTKAKNLDYVAMWYIKTAAYIQNTGIRAAFVSTNSIAQGEQPAALWKPLYENYGVHINFGIRTFKWESEASNKAAVHCVIVGFSTRETQDDLNPYLLKAPVVFIENRKKPLCDVPEMQKGSSPVDGGHLLLDQSECEELIKKEPLAEKYIRRFMGSEEYINNLSRYCLWLIDAKPSDIIKMPLVAERVERVRQMRLASKKEATRKFADYPMRFMELRQPATDYILIPRVSSENRKYIPIGFMNPDIIVSDAAIFMPDASLYHFGILISNVHMAWVRAVCGRLEMRYRYSNTIVYNNFPWPNIETGGRPGTVAPTPAPDAVGADTIRPQTPTPPEITIIESLAQAVLDARAEYPDSTLADMYGETSMLFHTKLLNAHRDLDRAVMKLYGFPVKDFSESDCVAALMELYKKLTANNNQKA